MTPTENNSRNTEKNDKPDTTDKMKPDKATQGGREYDVTPLRFCPECPFTEWTEEFYCPDCGAAFFPGARKGSMLRPTEEA